MDINNKLPYPNSSNPCGDKYITIGKGVNWPEFIPDKDINFI